MNKILRKTGISIAAICLFGAMLAGCQQAKAPVDASTNVDASSSTSQSEGTDLQASALDVRIVNVEVSDAEEHEPLVPMTFTEGEQADNPYYKRATNADGVGCFVVKRATDGVEVYLPMSEVALYISDEDTPNYYEKKTLTLDKAQEVDGVEQTWTETQTQYELCVSAVLPSETGAVDAPDASVEAEG